MICELAPSILSCDFGNLRESVTQLLDAGCERIHFDVMDGQFVPPITFGAQAVQALNDGRGFLEAHLMTMTPEHHFQSFVDAGCKGIIFHAEAANHSHRLLQQLREMGVQAGIAINPGTPVEAILPVLHLADLALVMTVNPGWGGQPFLSECLEKVKRIRGLYPNIDIEVDGGIDPQTLPLARAAGANVFVAGSYIVRQPSIQEGVSQLRRACEA